MAFTSGTAANYKDLLAAVVTFATANGWVALEQSENHAYLKGTGLAGLDEIYCGISAYEDQANSVFNWELHAALGYKAGRSIHNHPRGPGDNSTFVYLWGNQIPYWLIANGRRIVGVAKVGTIYTAFYLGLATPVGTDAQFPYPLVIGGAGYNSSYNYSRTDSYHALFFGGADHAGNTDSFGCYCNPGGVWMPINNSASGYNAKPVWTSKAIGGSVLNGLDESYMLDEIYLREYCFFMSNVNTSVTCRLDGIYAVSGYQNTAENIITANGVNYLVFPDIYRSGYGNFFALRLA